MENHVPIRPFKVFLMPCVVACASVLRQKDLEAKASLGYTARLLYEWGRAEYASTHL